MPWLSAAPAEPLPAEQLLQSLRAQGLNLLPCDEDFKLLLKQQDWHPPLRPLMGLPKHCVVEALACRDMVRVSGFWFRVSGFGFRVQGSGFRVQGVGFLEALACQDRCVAVSHL